MKHLELRALQDVVETPQKQRLRHSRWSRYHKKERDVVKGSVGEQLLHRNQYHQGKMTHMELRSPQDVVKTSQKQRLLHNRWGMNNKPERDATDYSLHEELHFLNVHCSGETKDTERRALHKVAEMSGKQKLLPNKSGRCHQQEQDVVNKNRCCDIDVTCTEKMTQYTSCRKRVHRSAPKNARHDINRCVRRKVAKDMREGYFNDRIPHPIHIITPKQYGAVKNNTILVTGMECFKDKHIPQDGIVMFHEIEHVGRNVKKEFDNQQKLKKFSTDRIPKAYVAVVIRARELTEIQDLQFIGEPTGNIGDSYAVLLAISNHKGQQRHQDNGWTPSIMGVFNEIRPNLVKTGGKMHFGSEGTCYGFGCVAKYCDVSGGKYGVTVGKYSCKKGKSVPQ